MILRNKIMINKIRSKVRNVAHRARGAYNEVDINRAILMIEVLINRIIHHLSKRKNNIKDIIIFIINMIN